MPNVEQDAEATKLQDPTDATSSFNAMVAVVWGILSRIHTGTMVKVMSVTNAGGVSPVGFVDLLPLVNQIARSGTAIPHITVYRCPYFRLQGGASAVILDPQVGDVGWAGFADRDISSVVANRGQANPGSQRQFDMSDAFYFGGWSGVVPTQYVQMNADGIRLHSPAAVRLEAPSVRIDCSTLTIAATASASITTPTLTINGNQVVNGSNTTNGATLFNGAISQTPGSQGVGAAKLDGPVNVTNDVLAAGKSLSTHTHHEHDGPMTSAPA